MLRPLRFSPFAWAKLLRLRDRGPTEVGGFGISAPDDLLLVEDFCLVKQQCSEVTVQLDDGSVADYFDRQVDRGLAPEQFARVWIHTHPGDSPYPSSTDEATFARCFGQSDWAVMFILARGGQTYARLRFSAGPGGALVIPVEIDFRQPSRGADFAAWDAEYDQSVTREVSSPPERRRRLVTSAREPVLDPWWDRPLRDEGPILASPFDDEFLPLSYMESHNEQFAAPF
jgi:proteasome lid subunit RPN8/RPN11